MLDHPASKLLELRIEDTVRFADFAWSYHQRLFLHGAPRESPFQLRRGRVDRAQRRFAQAAARLELEAVAWLSWAESGAVPAIDEQSKLAVARMHGWLTEHPVSERFPVGDDQAVVAAVDVFENVLANLRQRRMPGSGTDPFRHSVEAAAGQDVTPSGKPVPRRHVSASLFAARR